MELLTWILLGWSLGYCATMSACWPRFIIALENTVGAVRIIAILTIIILCIVIWPLLIPESLTKHEK